MNRSYSDDLGLDNDDVEEEKEAQLDEQPGELTDEEKDEEIKDEAEPEDEDELSTDDTKKKPNRSVCSNCHVPLFTSNKKGTPRHDRFVLFGNLYQKSLQIL